MEYLPGAFQLYRHYTGSLFQIIAVADHVETRERLVVYQAMSGDFKIYALPLTDFISKVDKEKYPEAKQTYCFERWETDRVQENAYVQDKADNREGEGSRSVGETDELKEMELSHEFRLDPMVLKFLDADSYEERLNILTGIRHRITDEMITTMSVACDLEVGDGSTQERFDALKNCLVTLEKYECNRIR